MPNQYAASTVRTDVCVLGGGPAGSALARRLRQLGHSVVIVEKQAFPRLHIGESLVSNVLPLLDVLGVRSEIESANFLRPTGTIVRWSEPVERRQSEGEPGFQVDRGRFDEILLRAAEKSGAQTLQPARVVSIKRRAERSWRIVVRCETAQVAIECKFVADATGRVGLLGGTKRRSTERTLALYTYWRCVPLDGPETRIEAGEDCWYWGAPLPGDEFNATVFIDAGECRKGVALAGSLNAFYEILLARSELLAPCLRGSRTGPVRGCDATPFYDDSPATIDTIKVGEATLSIDPLSSQGVQIAIGSALHAATVIHTVLQRPDDTALALEFYRMRQLESIALHSNSAGLFYREAARSRPNKFWQRRATLANRPEPNLRQFGQAALTTQTEIHLAPDVSFKTIPAIRGDYVVSSRAISCPGVSPDVAFLDGVEVGPLVAMIRQPIKVEQMLRAWSPHLSPNRAVGMLQWLWDRGIITPANPQF